MKLIKKMEIFPTGSMYMELNKCIRTTEEYQQLEKEMDEFQKKHDRKK